MSDLAKKLIAKEQKERTGKLDLGRCGLTDLEKEVPELFELVWLEELVLSNSYWDFENRRLKSWDHGLLNNLSFIPPKISKLRNLKKLRIGGGKKVRWKISKIEFLPNSIIFLDISFNRISKIECLPNSLITLDISHNLIERLENIPLTLTTLDIRGNLINDLSPILYHIKKGIPVRESWGGQRAISVDKCPLNSPPVEIAKQGNAAILNYFRQLEEEQGKEDYLFETKLLIIGEAGAGKTTFARRIQQADADMPSEGDSTHGINVDKWEFDVPAGTFKEINHWDASFHVNLWDFGGQEVYHGTHQFFFSKKSLYVLLCDTREQKTDFRYWLNTVEQLCGEDAHLFILFNRREDHDWQLDAGFRERFKQLIKEEYSLDLSIVESIPELQGRIKGHLQRLPDVGQKLIQSWVEIREDLAKETANDISFDRFKEICAAHNRTRPEDIENISRYFTRIGVFTHYIDDLVLRERVYLNSNHLVKTIYQLLDNADIKAFDGRIDKAEIERVWKKLGFEKERLPRLLEKFGLMYEVPKQDKYIIPEHLPDGAPYVHWSHEKMNPQLHFRYEFDKYMPKGLMSRLIVALHHYIGDHSLVWRRGVNLSHGGAHAEITESLGGVNRFDIRIVGDFRRDLLVIITQAFDHILSDFQKLSVSREVRCPCAECIKDKEPYFYKMEKIENAILKYEKSDLKVTCDKNYETIHVTELLGMVNYKWVLNQVKEKDEHGKIYSKVTELLDVVEKKVVPKINKINKSVEKLHEKFDALYDSLIAEIDQLKGDFFDSKNEEQLYFKKIEKLISENKKDEKNETIKWHDQPLKHKLKVTLKLPFDILKYEAEMDVSNFERPTTWKDFKRWFLKEK